MLDFLNIVWEFLQAASLPLILLLVGVDLVLGIFCAIKRGVFEWGKVAKFYQTMVVPYIGGYMVLQIAFTLLPSELGAILSPALSGAALAVILASLGASIMRHVNEIGIPVVPPEMMQ